MKILSKPVRIYFSHLQNICAIVTKNLRNYTVIFELNFLVKITSLNFLELPSNDPSKTDAMSLLLCGATMKLAKLKDIANSIFRMQGKFLQKDTVSKGCMIIANMITNSRKQKFTIVDNISHDILILGANTMNTLVTCQTQLPSKFLLKNVSFEERFKIVLDKKIEYGKKTKFKF